jgi:predicted nucleotidyltransferase
MSEDKRATIISMIRNTIREVEPTAQIILYGSRARGDARNDSDWDVLVIVDKEKTGLADYRRLCYPVYYKGLDFGEEINPTLYTKSEWESAPPSMFKFNVTQEGIAI